MTDSSVEKLFIPRLAIIGVGLIGGSLALALKAAGAVGEVVGIGRGQANLEKALELGVVDRISRDAAAGVRDADLVFLATPVLTLPEVAASIASHLKPGAILTDGGSVKGSVARAIEPLLPPGVHFVPGHPIAGTEKSGAEAAFATLYRGRRCILTPTDRTDLGALDLVRRIWEAAGSEVVLMDVRATGCSPPSATCRTWWPIRWSTRSAPTIATKRIFSNILPADFAISPHCLLGSDHVAGHRLTNRDALLEMMERFERFFAELKEDVEAAMVRSCSSFPALQGEPGCNPINPEVGNDPNQNCASHRRRARRDHRPRRQVDIPPLHHARLPCRGDDDRARIPARRGQSRHAQGLP
jgi:prephenate dehydrogenase